jgi:chemotaxis family two-component system sensor kinase Cph1
MGSCIAAGADLILELELARPGMIVNSVRGALPKLQEALTEVEACWIVAKEARHLTGFDRVMVYRFAHDWSGEVAEDREDGVDSYLGTHFPASDIPKQARELYTRKLLGLIPDVAYNPCPLTLSGGRATSRYEPMHPAQRIADPSRISSEHGRFGNAYHVAGDQR